MSWGLTPAGAADQAATAALSAPSGSRLAGETEALLGHRPGPATRSADFTLLARHFLGAIRARLGEPDMKAQLRDARAQLAETVAAAREDGIVPFVAAGNDNRAFADEAAGVSVLSGTPGLITVGAVDIGDPEDPADDRMMGRSSLGAEISAPGVSLPIGSPDPPADGRPASGRPVPKNVSGTSYGGPWAAAVAALMIKANPALQPADVEALLILAASSHDIAGTERDGFGEIDPLRAVAEAAR
jgi:subtilisin family serine protease